jgi:hypothetical protein
MSNKLFSEVLNGKKPESSFNGLPVEELKSLKNAASSIISRASDLDKRDKAQYLRGLIQTELDKLQPKEPKAEWKVKDTEELSLEDVNKALKQAQWYKHHYGPKEQAKWKKIKSTVDKADPLYTKAIKFLDKANDYYTKALNDEAHWQSIKDNMSDKMPKQHKQDAVNDILKEVAIGLDGARLNKKQQELLDKLKSMVK